MMGRLGNAADSGQRKGNMDTYYSPTDHKPVHPRDLQECILCGGQDHEDFGGFTGHEDTDVLWVCESCQRRERVENTIREECLGD